MNAVYLLSLALIQIWQLSLVIVVVAVVGRTVCRWRPHWAYALWMLALLKCLTPPIWSSPMGVFSWATSTRAEIAAPATLRKATHDLPALSNPPPASAPADAIAFQTQQRPTANLPTDQPDLGWQVSGSASILSIWTAGTLVVLLVYARHAMKIHGQLRHAVGNTPPELSTLVSELRQRIGTNRSVALLVSSEPIGPALMGLVHPRLVLPAALLNARSPESLAPIVAHELAHLRRGDQWFAVLQLVAQAVWWFHPLVWWMNREMNRSREMCCDEEVIAALHYDPSRYADTLLEVIRLRRQLKVPRFAPGMSPVEITAARLRHIMVDSPRFKRRTPAICWATALLTAIVLLPGAGLALSPNAPADETQAASVAKPAEISADGAVAILDQKPSQPGDEPPQKNGQNAAPASMSWTIVDGTTGKPIAGANVLVEHTIITSSGRKVLATTQHVSDSNGKYTVELPASEAVEPTVALLPRASHPGYADLGPMLYGYHHFRRNARSAVKSPFDTQRMYPGAEVTGIIHDPQGRPVADLLVKAYSASVKKNAQPPATGEHDVEDQAIAYGAFIVGEEPAFSNTEVHTDAEGRFRFMALKSGAMRFAVEPHDLAAATTLLGNKRGDIGIVQLERGVRVTGRVLDTAGKPVPNVWVNMRRAERRQPLDTTGDLTSRAAKADDAGNFALEPVLPARYRLTVAGEDETSAQSLGTDSRMPAAFDPNVLDVPAEGAFQPLEIRAIPSANVDIQFVDSAGKPFVGGDLVIEGRRGTRPYSRHLRSDEQGRIVTALPRDLTNLRLKAMTSEENAYRIREGENGELKSQHRINVGKLDHDINDLFFVRYRAAVLWFKMLDADGKPISGVDTRGRQAEGVEAEVAYKATAGRAPQSTDPFVDVFPIRGAEWRTMGLLPDEEFTLTVKAPGLKPESRTLKLGEGETREIEITLADSVP